MDLSPKVLLDVSLPDPTRRRFKIGDLRAGARDTNLVVGDRRWPGVQSIHIEDRPRGTGAKLAPGGGETLRILTVEVRRRGNEERWPLIPLNPFDAKVVVNHPQHGGEIASWELPAAAVARVEDLTKPGEAQRARIRFEAVVTETSVMTAVPVVSIRPEPFEPEPMECCGSAGPGHRAVCRNRPPALYGDDRVQQLAEDMTPEQLAELTGEPVIVDDGEVVLARDGDGWTLTVATNETGDSVVHRLTQAEAEALVDPVLHKPGVYGQHPDPGGRPCTVLKGATCHNPACVDERTDRGGKTECHAFEPGGNLLVSIPFDEPAEAIELDGSVTDRPELDFDEARALGVIVELNRRVLHPVGLAIGMADDDALTEAHLARIEAQNPGIDIDQVRASQSVRRRLVIWDGRDDPDGVVFGDWSEERVAKASAFMALEKERYPDRQAKLGFIWESPKCPKCGWALVPKPDGVSFGCVRRECLMGTSG